MYLTPERVEQQINKADKLQKILWRLYSPYRSHRKLIVMASALVIQALELLEKLKIEVEKDFKNEIDHPLPTKSIPPGGYDHERVKDEKEK